MNNSLFLLFFKIRISPLIHVTFIESLMFRLLGANWRKANRFVHWMIPDPRWSSRSCLQELAGTNSSFDFSKGLQVRFSWLQNPHCYMLSRGSSGAPQCVDSSRMVPFWEDNPVRPSVPALSPSLRYLEKSRPVQPVSSWPRSFSRNQDSTAVLLEPFPCHLFFYLSCVDPCQNANAMMSENLSVFFTLLSLVLRT